MSEPTQVPQTRSSYLFPPGKGGSSFSTITFLHLGEGDCIGRERDCFNGSKAAELAAGDEVLRILSLLFDEQWADRCRGTTPGLTLQPDAEFQTAALLGIHPGLFGAHPSRQKGMNADRHPLSIG